MANWTTADIPRQTGRLAVITGATGGLGFETALALAGAGANVVLTGRNEQKAQAALAAIRGRYPAAQISYAHLDLASLASVRGFAEQFAEGHAALDLLINNAGVMMPPTRQTTADGFELQFGTNYLGHFALTERLLPLLRAGREPRVVNLSSLAHKTRAAIHFDDLQWQRSYKPWPAYAQSKLAMLMFALELQRRSDANGWGLLSNAAHPGYARTDLIANGPGADTVLQMLNRVTFEPLASQSAADGALPTLFAATAPEARPAGYYGPSGFFELKGPPGDAQIAPHAQDKAVAARLWAVSEALTNARWPGAIVEHATS
ncbi:short-chain alcohol dehydrogenase [Burkholderia sp. Ch1-1]|uniref:Short-chain alcohol dehydrogenase n=1 Tax=Paraburkholderia dioscoreae TaxID=2604047 RepID=A0A5Q4Z795_9BURK|nr:MULTISPECIES: SDR family oxidoreductase [Paraburkholderia]EIF28835.1 short-chain alcohol dehydrogenase [Burkholderia sp. Ch1-1]MDR8400691.1 SDR family oxidoreductase [Paraburkholderia sp. USG1]VVD26699.1 Short-chain alcohol dehydrogenase [Paraburkholderia dioscoreae]